jgi:PII-like signaling protein
MSAYEQALLMRIFVSESDQFGDHPLYEAIVMKAREMGLAGATVLRGAMGYGKSSRLHTAKILRLSEDLPVVVEIVDNKPMIRRFIDAIEPMTAEVALVTIEEITAVRYARPAQT